MGNKRSIKNRVTRYKRIMQRKAAKQKQQDFDVNAVAEQVAKNDMGSKHPYAHSGIKVVLVYAPQEDGNVWHANLTRDGSDKPIRQLSSKSYRQGIETADGLAAEYGVPLYLDNSSLPSDKTEALGVCWTMLLAHMDIANSRMARLTAAFDNAAGANPAWTEAVSVAARAMQQDGETSARSQAALSWLGMSAELRQKNGGTPSLKLWVGLWLNMPEYEADSDGSLQSARCQIVAAVDDKKQFGLVSSEWAKEIVEAMETGELTDEASLRNDLRIGWYSFSEVAAVLTLEDIAAGKGGE